MTRPTLFIDARLTSTAAALVAAVARSEAVVERAKHGQLPRMMTDKGDIIALPLILLHLTTGTSLAVGSAAQQSESDRWAELVTSVDAEGVTTNVLDYVNEHALHHSYLVSSHVTAVDFAIFAALHESVSRWTEAEFAARPSLARWFSHVQTFQSMLPMVHVPLPPSKLLTLDLSSATSAPTKVAIGAGNAASNAAAAVGAAITSAAHSVAAAVTNTVAAVTDKKDKKAKAAPAEVPQIYRLDLRVAKVVSVANHPTEARLLVLSLDCGEPSGPRTVVSGIADYVADHQALVGKHVLNMCNLQPGNIKGIDSNGRILVATDSANDKLKEILYVTDSEAGERIVYPTIDVSKNPLDGTIAPKNLHRVLKGLHTNETGVAQFESLDIATKSGPVRCSIKNGTVA